MVAHLVQGVGLNCLKLGAKNGIGIRLPLLEQSHCVHEKLLISFELLDFFQLEQVGAAMTLQTHAGRATKLELLEELLGDAHESLPLLGDSFLRFLLICLFLLLPDLDGSTSLLRLNLNLGFWNLLLHDGIRLSFLDLLWDQ